MNLKVKRHLDIKFFNGFSIELKYNSVASAFSFSLFFDPKNEQHRVLWQPGHYHVVDVEHNGELLIRGFVLSQNFSSGAEKKLSTVSGYSLSGVLEDCQIPTSIYPLQSDGKSLTQIASRLVSAFSQKNSPMELIVDDSVSNIAGSVFEKTTASETQSVKQYLDSIAAQKNIVLSHTPEGNLLLTKAKTKQKPIYHFEKNMPGTSMTMSFSGQSMHSTITLLKQASADGGNAGEDTISNPYVPFVRRPKVKSQSSGNDNDTISAARKSLSEELKNIKLTITTSVWEIEGKIIKPNNIISITNDELYLYGRTNWFIESVKLSGNEKGNTSILTCVLPEVYNSEPVKNIFEEMTDWRSIGYKHSTNEIS